MSSLPRSSNPLRPILCLLILLIGVSPTLAESRRDVAQAEHPQVLPPPSMRHDDDRVLPMSSGIAPTDPRDGVLRAEDLVPAAGGTGREKAPPPGAVNELGGDDVIVSVNHYLDTPFLDIASNGDIYLGEARHTGSPDYHEYIEVYRSQDGGTTFSLFGTIDSGGPEYDRLLDLDVCEGAVDRVYLTYMHYDVYRGGFVGRVAYEDLSASSATWTEQTVFDTPGVSFLNPDLAADDASYSGYYLYAVVAGLDGNGDDIWYSRSTDQGATWSAPYRIASLTSSGNLMYSQPKIAFGYGGTLHVAYTYTERLQSTFDDGVRYRQATSFGSSSSDWAPSTYALTSTGDGIDQNVRGVAASTAAGKVMISYTNYVGDSHVFYDEGNGTSWSISNIVDLPLSSSGECIYVPPTGDFHVGGKYPQPSAGTRSAMLTADESALTSWTVPQVFSELPPSSGLGPSMATDPSHSNRLAWAWRTNVDGVTKIVFDAEWRSDPGYPNAEEGFPLDLPVSTAGRATSPALADIDGDSHADIVFGNTDGQLFAVSAVTGMIPGWPRDVGDIPFGSAVAVGDLNGNGEMSVVQGTTDGRVYCYDPSGHLREGFPVDLGTGAATYVSIGPAGPPYLRWILVASGNRFARINYRGLTEFKSGYLNGTYTSAPAIGDIDDDGDEEVVVNFDLLDGVSSGVHVYNADLQGGVQAYRSFPSTVSDAVSLGDLDLDGDLEIFHPTEGGLLYVMDSALTDLPGFPFDNGSGYGLSRVALGNMLWTSEPEIAVNSRNWQVHVLYYDGSQQYSYPASTGNGWWLYGSPVIGDFVENRPFVFAAARDRKAWAFENVHATLPPGWPKDLGEVVETTPAIGDIDGDGHLELVYATDTHLAVLDAQVASGDNPTPMYGFDSARTGCFQCSEPTPTAVGDPVTSRLAFRVSTRNPATGPVSFAADLPRAAGVELAIYDVRGRKVRGLERRQMSSGHQVFVFDGRDDRGMRLAHGQYFARLSVRGRGLDDTVTRRFLLID
jgi:hypothetical protein